MSVGPLAAFAPIDRKWDSGLADGCLADLG